MSVLAVTELASDGWHPISAEALAAGRAIAAETGSQLHALVIGTGVGDSAASVHADAIHTADAEGLGSYTPDRYSAVLQAAVRALQPVFVVLPHTYQVRDFGPKAATALGKPFVSDVVAIRFEDGQPVFVRQMFQGKLNADVSVPDGPPYFVSVQSGAFPAAAEGGESGALSSLDLGDVDLASRSEPGAPFREASGEVDLTKANLIVSVGRGIKEPENIKIAEELAAAMGAELAASRPICDAGWMPLERQVGSSGQSVAPDAYVALGISGAIQHVVGMKGAKTIVAINSDESAPIFEIADYGIVADLFDVVPALTKRLSSA